MHIRRMFRSVVFLGGLACLTAPILPGCGDDSVQSGGQVKEDPAEAEKRAAKIKEMYKANPPGKGSLGSGGAKK